MAHSLSVVDNGSVIDIRYHVDSNHHHGHVHDHDSLGHGRSLCHDSLERHDHRDNRFDLMELEIALSCYLPSCCLNCYDFLLEIEMVMAHQ